MKGRGAERCHDDIEIRIIRTRTRKDHDLQNMHFSGSFKRALLDLRQQISLAWRAFVTNLYAGCGEDSVLSEAQASGRRGRGRTTAFVTDRQISDYIAESEGISDDRQLPAFYHQRRVVSSHEDSSEAPEAFPAYRDTDLGGVRIPLAVVAVNAIPTAHPAPGGSSGTGSGHHA
eukprot:GSA25T00013820001.1